MNEAESLPSASAAVSPDTASDAAPTSEEDAAEAKRLPLIARIYGAIVLVNGAATLPLVVLGAIRAVNGMSTEQLQAQALGLTFILSVLYVAVLSANAIALIVFAVFLLRNHRRHAATWAYALIPMTLAEGMLSLALRGLGANLIIPCLQLLILVALSVALDPELLTERRLQREAKRRNQHADYLKARSAGMLGRDPSGKGYIALDFFNVFWLFVVGSVFGLVVETIYHVAIYHEWQDRAGLLWGPFSPIYGCGAVILTVCLNRLWKANPLLLFCTSAVIGGAFEYFVSWFMQVAFGIRAWDYTGQWLSIDGRTSGKYMVFWGVLGLLWMRLILPRLLALINRIPWKVRYSLTAICFTLLVVDAAMTLMALDAWYGRVSGTTVDSPVTRFFAEHFNDAYMQHRFQTMTLDPALAGRAD